MTGPPSADARNMAGAVRQLRRTNGCANPIRLHGRRHRVDSATGEVVSSLDASSELGGALVVACGDRRAAKCPSCARTYQGDAFQLVAAGLRGGKGIPDAVAGHPAVLVTLTAPSFGRVHTIRDRDGFCPCHQRHTPGDPVLGTPLDPAAYRYRDQVIWNNAAPVLWKRTAQAIRRRLAQELGVPRRALGETVRVRFVKVAEFQRRGVVHFHVLIRADGPGEIDADPPSSVTSVLLERVVRDAARAVCVVLPSPGASNEPSVVRWGGQLDVVSIDQATASRAAGYVAKYATKATEAVAGGVLIPRVRSVSDAETLNVPLHAKRLVKAALKAGRHVGLGGARRWAHQFGYGGHVLTKSRDFSVTFGVLRAARCTWRAASNEREVVAIGRLAFAGRGYTTGADGLQVAIDALSQGDP